MPYNVYLLNVPIHVVQFPSLIYRIIGEGGDQHGRVTLLSTSAIIGPDILITTSGVFPLAKENLLKIPQMIVGSLHYVFCPVALQLWTHSPKIVDPLLDSAQF